MRFNRELVGVDAAQKRILEHLVRQPTEEVPLAESIGRRLAEPVIADHPVPHFRRSGVDGYAIIAADSAGAVPGNPVSLSVVENIPSGTVPVHEVKRGQAARIMTGAFVPEGADAVVMLEMTSGMEGSGKEGDKVLVGKQLAAGENVTPVGREIRELEVVLEPGRVIRSGEAAILAAFGCDTVKVYRQPKVAIFSTGSELLAVKDAIAPGKIRNSNSYMLAALVLEAGAVPLIMPVLPDDVNMVSRALDDAFRDADIVITTGGVSVGDKDVLVDYYEQWQGTMLFNKVAMRPGSPTTAGACNGKMLFSLSGNPGASFVGFELFVRPYLRGILGQPEPLHREVTGIFDADYDKGSAYPRYVRGSMSIVDGRLHVKPAGLDKSSIMISIKDTDCLICVPAGGRGLRPGEKARVLCLT